MSDKVLSVEEKRLYDRQIRLWGLEAQKRVQSSHVLIIGSRALAAEVLKNISLAGMGKLKLTFGDLDGNRRQAAAIDRCGNFLVSSDSEGKDRLDCMAESVKDLNGSVIVEVDHGDISSKEADYFAPFSVVIASECSLALALKIDEYCAEKKISFFWAGCHGFFGFYFSNHDGHSYVTKSGKGDPQQCTVSSSSLKSLLSADWNARTFRRSNKMWHALHVVYQYRAQQPDISLEQFAGDFLKAKNVDEAHIPADTLSELNRMFGTELSPVAAVCGGVVAQETLKVVQAISEPWLNVFLIDGRDGAGVLHHFQA